MKPGDERTAHTYLLPLAPSGAIKLTYNCVPQAPPTRLSLETAIAAERFHKGGAPGETRAAPTGSFMKM